MCKKLRELLSAAAMMAIGVLLLGGASYGATINVQVVTDRGVYGTGDTVYWTVYAWASKGDNRGVALLSADLDDSTPDTLELPWVDADQFEGSAYGTMQKFVKLVDPVISPVPPELRGIIVMQLPTDRRLDIGNDGRQDHVLAKGSYTVASRGRHTLAAVLNGANYWPDPVSTASRAFELINSYPAYFMVGGLEGDVNGDYCVDMADFATVAAWWASTECHMPPYCGGADITRDGVVDLGDAAIVAGQWLSCEDPGGGLSGDINGDRYVNMVDLSMLAKWWGSSQCHLPPYCGGADISGDGQIDLRDAAVVASQWLWCDDPANSACSAD